MTLIARFPGEQWSYLAFEEAEGQAVRFSRTGLRQWLEFAWGLRDEPARAVLRRLDQGEALRLAPGEGRDDGPRIT